MGASVLVTGFVPFPDYRVNSSEQVVRALAAVLPKNIARTEILPVDHLLAHRRMGELLEEVRPKACLAMGMWQGSAFRIEQFGRRCPGLVEVGGEDELEGAWDWDAMAERLGRTGRPVIHSQDAGKYVCDT